MDWYSNPWIIGVVGSIPSGFLVNWASGYFLGKRENREYLQKVISANREIVYAIRPGISEGQIPTADVLTALANATARRYAVEASDLYSAAQIAEELVKEVMDSSFISSERKAEYCARLTELSGVAPPENLPETVGQEVQPRTIVEYRDRLVSYVSMIMGVLTVTVTMMYSLLEFIRSRQLELYGIGTGLKELDLFVPVLAAMTSMAVAILFVVVYRDFLRRRANSTDKHISEFNREKRERVPRPNAPE